MAGGFLLWFLTIVVSGGMRGSLSYEVGNMFTEFKVEQGRVKYAVPLVLPKGFPEHLFKPELLYDSAAGQGSLGFGWSITGLSQISRCAPTQAQDGYSRGIRYDSQDPYCLDGSRLVLEKGKYGMNGSIYRGEIDTFFRAYATGTQGSGPMMFVTLTKNNQQLKFGSQDKSRVNVPGEKSIHAWKLDSISDYTNNIINISYMNDENAGGIFVESIIHKTIAIKFYYESRNDIVDQYWNGKLLYKLDKRLKSIRTFVNDKMHRELKITYADVKMRKLSVITGLQLCSRESKCLKPVRLGHSGIQDVNHANAPAYWSNQFGQSKKSGGWNSNDHPRHIVDMNDDGLPDVVGFSNGGVFVALNQQGSFKTGKIWVASYGSKCGGWGKNHPKSVVDVDADHLPDIVGFANDGVYVALNTGTESFTKPKLWLAEFGHKAGGWRTDRHVRLIKDMNGDGLADIVGFGDNGVSVSLGTGSSFQKPTTWIRSFAYKADGWRVESHLRYLEDINGDGLPDVIGFGFPGVYAAINTGSSFGPPTLWIKGSFGYYQGWRNSDHPRFVADVNGDGLADIVGFSHSGVQVSLSTGTIFLQPKIWTDAFGVKHGWKMNKHPRFLSDMNGDGLIDVVGFASSGIQVALNTGSSFAKAKQWVSGYSNSAQSPKYLADVTGDGIPDIIGFEDSGVYVSTNNNGQTLMTSVTDSYGNGKEVTYSTLADKTVYSRGEWSSYPNPKLNVAQTIVKKLRESNGVGGFNVSEFSYKGMRVNVKGRGSLGFSEISRIGHENDEQVITSYMQIFPLTGAIKSITKKIGGTVIFNSEKSYSSSERLFQMEKEIVRYYELNGDWIKTELLTLKFDKFGNILQLDKTTSGKEKDKVFKETTKNGYKVDPKTWFIGNLLFKEVLYKRNSFSSRRRSTYHYNAETRNLAGEIREPGSYLALNISYIYNRYGNVIEKHETPLFGRVNDDKSSKSRSVFTTYDSLSVKKLSTMNSLGHVESYTYDSYGNLVSLTGVNGQISRYTYDAFDRTVLEIRSDGLSINRSIHFFEEKTQLEQGVYVENVLCSGAKDTVKVYDSLDRPIRIISTGFKGNFVYNDIEYDLFGRVTRQSFPYYINNQQPAWITYEYDKFGREISEERPYGDSQSSKTRRVYKGLVTNNIDANGNIRRVETDLLGRIIKVTDALNGTVEYKYNAIGNLIDVIDPKGHTVKMSYDEFGNKILMNDPDMGMWSYSYNAHGDKIMQRDSVGQETYYKYDALGRLLEEKDSEGKRKWFYDQGENSKGKLVKTQSPSHVMEYNYNKEGRQTLVSQQIGGETFIVKSGYDEYGRISVQFLPGDKTVYYCYDDHGFLTEVRRTACDHGASGTVYWKAIDYDASGHVAAELFGNSLLTLYSLDPSSNINSIKTWDDNGREKRHWEYSYDAVGNVVSRTDMAEAWQTLETFSFDALDRITRATISSVQPRKKAAFSEDWEYDSIGNIVRYSGFGGSHFQYGNKRPHALLKAGPHTYDYDANGNVIRKDSDTITWTTFNKPSTITSKSVGTVEFVYDAEHRRVKKSSDAESVTYIGKLYEKTTTLSPFPRKTTQRYFIYALGRLVAIDSEVRTADSELHSFTNYLHGDLLDSVDTVSNDRGEIVESLRYNAYGRKRSMDWAKFQDCVQAPEPASKYTNRGFTGHEHLEDLLLIHMNGRIYDPVVGRFLSPDPNIQDPYNTQNYNRYSYTLNNPLKHKDPTGYIVNKIGGFLKKIWRPVLAISASVLTMGAATPVFASLVTSAGLMGTTAAVVSQALAGAASGFVGGAIASNSFKGGLQSAFGGAMSGGVGGFFGSTWNLERVATEALVGGVSTAVSGGKFKDGLLLSGITASARHLYNSVVRYDVDWKPGGPAQVKSESAMPIEGANNVGTQGHETIDPEGWVNEGGKLSRFGNHIPGVNAVAGMHDVFQINLDRISLPHARLIFNVPGIIPASVVTYAALMQGPASQALLVEKRRR